MLGSAIPRIGALKSLSAKSIWRHPEWVLKLHDAVANSIWKYGSIAFAAMGEHLWDKLKKTHARCVKFYCGAPSFAGYETVCNHASIKTIKDELRDHAKKRITAMI